MVVFMERLQMADTRESQDDTLNSLLNEANKAGTPAADQPMDDTKPVEIEEDATTQEPEETTYEVAGKTFRNEDELRDWVSSLRKDYTVKTQRLSEMEKEFTAYKEQNSEAIELADYFKKNPKFQEEVLNIYEKYARSLQSGHTPSQAAKKAGLNDMPPEVQEAVKAAQELKAYREEQLASQQDADLQDEIDALKKAVPGLTDKHVEKILREALKWNGRVIDPETGEHDVNADGISLMEVYKMLNAKSAWQKAAKAKDTGVHSVASPYVEPANPKTSPEDNLKSILKNAGYA